MFLVSRLVTRPELARLALVRILDHRIAVARQAEQIPLCAIHRHSGQRRRRGGIRAAVDGEVGKVGLHVDGDGGVEGRVGGAGRRAVVERVRQILGVVAGRDAEFVGVALVVVGALEAVGEAVDRGVGDKGLGASGRLSEGRFRVELVGDVGCVSKGTHRALEDGSLERRARGAGPEDQHSERRPGPKTHLLQGSQRGRPGQTSDASLIVGVGKTDPVVHGDKDDALRIRCLHPSRHKSITSAIRRFATKDVASAVDPDEDWSSTSRSSGAAALLEDLLRHKHVEVQTIFRFQGDVFALAEPLRLTLGTSSDYSSTALHARDALWRLGRRKSKAAGRRLGERDVGEVEVDDGQRAVTGQGVGGGQSYSYSKDRGPDVERRHREAVHNVAQLQAKTSDMSGQETEICRYNHSTMHAATMADRDREVNAKKTCCLIGTSCTSRRSG
nr:hypothetical protein CFP56_13140 [Quercus suber]